MTPAEIRFAADGMLQSLATWLRVLGYDCAGRPGQFGRALLEQAIAENRVFLTRNAHLTDNLPRALLSRAEVFQVAGQHLPEQLRQIVETFSLERERFAFTRCVQCNLPLRCVDRTAAEGRVPADVLACEKEFWSCASCGKTFWRGSHVQNSLLRLQQWLLVPGAS